MPYDVRLEVVASQPMVVVRARLRPAEYAARLLPLFDQVYAYLGTAPAARRGQNVILYQATYDLEAGVQVFEALQPSLPVEMSQTPGGRVATTAHFGPYAELGAAHAAVRAWCAAQQLPLTRVSWEVYGDHDDDPSRLRTDVFYQIDEAC